MVKLLSLHHSLPLKAGGLEVEKNRQAQTCDGQVTRHLGDVRVIEYGHNFRIDDHFAINDQVGDERSDVCSLVIDRKAALLLDVVTALTQLNNERVFVESLIEAGL